MTKRQLRKALAVERAKAAALLISRDAWRANYILAVDKLNSIKKERPCD